MKKYLLLLFLLLLLVPAKAQIKLSDEAQISILTAAPSDEAVFTLYGHTAVRVKDSLHKIDLVFNYGIFDFSKPNFIYRFTKGETDYKLAAYNFQHYIIEYQMRGSEVTEQVLNFTPDEINKIWNALYINVQPENCVYRYNFFFDNCATRPRDQIEAAIDGTLQYADNMTDTDTGVTFRDLLHKYSEGHPWSRFGMDLCMGSKADQPINRRLMMFVPFYVQDFFNTARIVDNEGQARPLVSSEEKIVVTGLTDADHRSGGITPMQSALLLFVLVAAATIYGIRRGKTLWGLDLILFFCAGIAGCILAFLALFSQHPAVSPNYLLFVFHPLHLFCLPWMINKVRKRQKSWYMRTNCAVLTLFILLWAIIPQRIDLAVLPLALCLLVRSASNLILTLKKR